MFIHGAIKKAKAQEAEKVAISLKVSIEVKTKLQKIADENNVSLNNLCASILESVLDGELDDQGTMKLIENLDDAKKTLSDCQKIIRNGDDTIEAVDGTFIDFHVEEKIALAKISAITAELRRRGAK